MPANPAYLMALPTENDPMLGYLTTAFQATCACAKNSITKSTMTCSASSSVWKSSTRRAIRPRTSATRVGLVRLPPCERRPALPRGDLPRGQKMQEVRNRGVYLAQGYDGRPWKMEAKLDQEIRELYADSKNASGWAFAALHRFPAECRRAQKPFKGQDGLHPASADRRSSGGCIPACIGRAEGKKDPAVQVQIIVSDGLNAHAVMDPGHLAPYLSHLEKGLKEKHRTLAPELRCFKADAYRPDTESARSCSGISQTPEHKAIIHIIGERPAPCITRFPRISGAARSRLDQGRHRPQHHPGGFQRGGHGPSSDLPPPKP